MDDEQKALKIGCTIISDVTTFYDICKEDFDDLANEELILKSKELSLSNLDLNCCDKILQSDCDNVSASKYRITFGCMDVEENDSSNRGIPDGEMELEQNASLANALFEKTQENSESNNSSSVSSQVLKEANAIAFSCLEQKTESSSSSDMMEGVNLIDLNNISNDLGKSSLSFASDVSLNCFTSEQNFVVDAELTGKSTIPMIKSLRKSKSTENPNISSGSFLEEAQNRISSDNVNQHSGILKNSFNENVPNSSGFENNSNYTYVFHKHSANLKRTVSTSMTSLPSRYLSGKYDHVKSKVRAYIRNSRSCNTRSRSVSPGNSLSSNENCISSQKFLSKSMYILNDELISSLSNRRADMEPLITQIKNASSDPNFVQKLLQVIVSERKNRIENEKLFSALQLRYDNLLAQHASSQNVIDQLRLQLSSRQRNFNAYSSKNVISVPVSRTSTPVNCRRHSFASNFDGGNRYLSLSQPDLIKRTTCSVSDPFLCLSCDESGSLYLLPDHDANDALLLFEGKKGLDDNVKDYYASNIDRNAYKEEELRDTIFVENVQEYNEVKNTENSIHDGSSSVKTEPLMTNCSGVKIVKPCKVQHAESCNVIGTNGTSTVRVRNKDVILSTFYSKLKDFATLLGCEAISEEETNKVWQDLLDTYRRLTTEINIGQFSSLSDALLFLSTKYALHLPSSFHSLQATIVTNTTNDKSKSNHCFPYQSFYHSKLDSENISESSPKTSTVEVPRIRTLIAEIENDLDPIALEGNCLINKLELNDVNRISTSVQVPELDSIYVSNDDTSGLTQEDCDKYICILNRLQKKLDRLKSGHAICAPGIEHLNRDIELLLNKSCMFLTESNQCAAVNADSSKESNIINPSQVKYYQNQLPILEATNDVTNSSAVTVSVQGFNRNSDSGCSLTDRSNQQNTHNFLASGRKLSSKLTSVNVLDRPRSCNELRCKETADMIFERNSYSPCSVHTEKLKRFQSNYIKFFDSTETTKTDKQFEDSFTNRESRIDLSLFQLQQDMDIVKKLLMKSIKSRKPFFAPRCEKLRSINKGSRAAVIPFLPSAFMNECGSSSDAKDYLMTKTKYAKQIDSVMIGDSSYESFYCDSSTDNDIKPASKIMRGPMRVSRSNSWSYFEQVKSKSDLKSATAARQNTSCPRIKQASQSNVEILAEHSERKNLSESTNMHDHRAMGARCKHSSSDDLSANKVKVSQRKRSISYDGRWQSYDRSFAYKGICACSKPNSNNEAKSSMSSLGTCFCFSANKDRRKSSACHCYGLEIFRKEMHTRFKKQSNDRLESSLNYAVSLACNVNERSEKMLAKLRQSFCAC